MSPQNCIFTQLENLDCVRLDYIIFDQNIVTGSILNIQKCNYHYYYSLLKLIGAWSSCQGSRASTEGTFHLRFSYTVQNPQNLSKPPLKEDRPLSSDSAQRGFFFVCKEQRTIFYICNQTETGNKCSCITCCETESIRNYFLNSVAAENNFRTDKEEPSH